MLFNGIGSADFELRGSHDTVCSFGGAAVVLAMIAAVVVWAIEVTASILTRGGRKGESLDSYGSSGMITHSYFGCIDGHNFPSGIRTNRPEI